MISKPIPPFNGLTSLITSCTTNGIVEILLPVLISTNMKLGVLYLKLGKVVW
jgi:hypothetical protein